MIRVRFVYDNQELLKEPRESKLLRYQKDDFYRLIQGRAGDENKKPPCRDEASVRFIREIDHAEFVEGDWYSIVTPFGRTNITALCGGTKYALTVIDNSQCGFYTSFEGYGKDIWGRLADLPFDALIFYLVSDLNIYYSSLPFPYAIEERVVIENYRRDGTETEAYLRSCLSQGQEVVDGKLYVENCFEDFGFDLCRDFDLLVEKAKNMLSQKNKLQNRPPLIMSTEEFAKTLHKGYTEFLCDYLDGTNYWYDDYEEINRFLKNLTIHNYMNYIPSYTLSKYPMYIVIKKNRHTGEYTVKNECGWKNPDIGCVLIEDFLRLSDKERNGFEKLTIVIDSELFWHGADELEYALWAFRMYDNIAELYDGDMIYKVFVDFVRKETK